MVAGNAAALNPAQLRCAVPGKPRAFLAAALVLCSAESLHAEGSAHRADGTLWQQAEREGLLEREGRRHGRNVQPVPFGPSQFLPSIVDDMPPPQWFGNSFHDSPAAINPWVNRPEARMIGDMFPTAPLDRTDVSTVNSWTGAAPVQPDVVGNTGISRSYLEPDFVTPYTHPAPFPWEKEPNSHDSSEIPIGKRTVVASPDAIRPHGRWEMSAKKNYPLVAPADRIGGRVYPVAEEDLVPNKFTRYIEQLHDIDADRRIAKEIAKIFTTVDTDLDLSISPDEYTAEIEGHQTKSAEMAQRLWDQFHKSDSQDMTETDFKRLAATGFDLGQSFVPREDINLVLVPEFGAPIGFWGGGSACPAGKFVKGVKLKVMPLNPTEDNTALNAVAFMCDDGTEITSTEGPDGDWTAYATCPDDQFVYSVRVRNRRFGQGLDNTGMNDLMFFCRTASLSATSELRFGDPAQSHENVIVAQGTPAVEGGWENELTCGSSLFLCGIQVRLQTEQGDEDDIGVTDIRFFCCTAPIDCSSVCDAAPGASGNSTASCQACRDAANPTTAHNALLAQIPLI